LNFHNILLLIGRVGSSPAPSKYSVIDLFNVPGDPLVIESQRDRTQDEMALKQQKTAL
jgi:hypothetical protein